MKFLDIDETNLREEFGIPLDAEFNNDAPVKEYEWYDPLESVPPWNKGKKMDEYYRQTCREVMARRENTNTPEVRAKISATMKGVKKTKTHAQNISKGLTGHKRTEESKRKQSESMKGTQRARKYFEGDTCKTCDSPPFASGLCRKCYNKQYQDALRRRRICEKNRNAA